MDTIDRLPQTGDRGIYLKQQLKDKLIEHKQYIARHGQDLPEIRNWKWGPGTAGLHMRTSGQGCSEKPFQECGNATNTTH
jgi:xylulose-5-phosphate/fructose-6-phosphate phosphoketolase